MTDLKQIIVGEKPTLVKFSAEWCAPCQSMKPIVENIKSSQNSKVNFVDIDVDQSEELANQYHVQTVPTFIIFKQGEAMWRHSGVIAERELKAMLENYY